MQSFVRLHDEKLTEIDRNSYLTTPARRKERGHFGCADRLMVLPLACVCMAAGAVASPTTTTNIGVVSLSSTVYVRLLQLPGTGSSFTAYMEQLASTSSESGVVVLDAEKAHEPARYPRDYLRLVGIFRQPEARLRASLGLLHATLSAACTSHAADESAAWTAGVAASTGGLAQLLSDHGLPAAFATHYRARNCSVRRHTRE